MANKLYEENDVQAIANAIRSKTGGEEQYKVSEMAPAILSIPTGSEPNLTTTEVTPTESAQHITPQDGYDGFSSVDVGAISKNYIGSNIPIKTENDVTKSGSFTYDASMLFPAGYYSSSHGIFSAPYIAVDNNTGTITDTITYAKYQSLGTIGTLSATKKLPTKSGTTIIPSKASTTAISKGEFATGDIVVGKIPDSYIIPTGSETITENGTVDVTNLAEVVVDVAGSSGGDYNVESTTNADGTQNIIITDAEGGGGGSIVVGIGKNAVLLDSFTDTWTLADTSFDRNASYATYATIMPSIPYSSEDAHVYTYPEPSYYTDYGLVAISKTKIEYEYDESIDLSNQNHILMAMTNSHYYSNRYPNISNGNVILTNAGSGSYSTGIAYLSNRTNGGIYCANTSAGIHVSTTLPVSFGSTMVKIGRSEYRALASTTYMPDVALSALKGAKFTRTTYLYRVDAGCMWIDAACIVRNDIFNETVKLLETMPASASFMMLDEDEPFEEEIIEPIEEGDEMP